MIRKKCRDSLRRLTTEMGEDKGFVVKMGIRLKKPGRGGQNDKF